MAMATIRFVPSPSPSPFQNSTRAAAATVSISLASLPLQPSLQFQCPKLSLLFQSRETFVSSSLPWPSTSARGVFTFLAVVDEEQVVTEEFNREETVEEKNDYLGSELKNQPRTTCELYVCNLPRSCGISELSEMFKPFGSVVSVKVSCNPVTGVSRGCGYITMGSIKSARKAIAALDGSELGGREMRVRFSVDMSSGRKNAKLLSSAPSRYLIYESPYKLYIGNLSWTVTPEELRNQFSQFGTVVSARVLYDRKGGKNRAYGFVSFSSAAERDAALSLNGTDLAGRIIVVRTGVEK